jgi:hypothetical protein
MTYFEDLFASVAIISHLALPDGGTGGEIHPDPKNT